MRILLHQQRVVAPLENMPHQAVAAIDALRIDAVQLPHALAEIALGRFDHQVIVVAHLAVGVDDEVKARGDQAEHLEPGVAVGVVAIDGVAPVAAAGHMVQRAGEFESERSGHRKTLAGAGIDVMITRRTGAAEIPVAVAVIAATAQAVYDCRH